MSLELRGAILDGNLIVVIDKSIEKSENRERVCATEAQEWME